MTHPNLRILANAEEISRAAAETVVQLSAAAQAARGRFTVALSGGSTPRRLYEILSDAPFRGQINWARVEFFWGDERSVPPDHADSNYRMAYEALLKKLDLRPSQIHRLEAERPDREAAAADYQRTLAKAFGIPAVGPPPALDLVLLGMGPDAHTASLFPQTSALRETNRWVVANYVPKFQTFRLTLTARMLNQAAQVLFLVAGPDKAAPLAEVLHGPADPERLPAQLIRPVQGTLTWYLDSAAAARLPTPAR